MDPGKGMTNKNFLTEVIEHRGGLILETTVSVFWLHYEAKLINFDDDTLKVLKPNKAQNNSKFIRTATV